QLLSAQTVRPRRPCSDAAAEEAGHEFNLLAGSIAGPHSSERGYCSAGEQVDSGRLGGIAKEPDISIAHPRYLHLWPRRAGVTTGKPPFPSLPCSRTVLAGKGSLRRIFSKPKKILLRRA